MDIEVEVVSSPYSSVVSVEQASEIEVAPTLMGTSRFTDLLDFDDTDKNDQYVIMYDSTTQTYKLVNPDTILSSAAADEPIQPGLPEDFENVLDVDLDNRIDLDAGSF
jgi:hypothetical protein